MEISRIRALRGPNLWSRHTAIEALVNCTADETRIGSLGGFEERLRARFPEIGSMRPIGFEDDISVAHVLAFAALGLQAQAGCPVSFCVTAPTVEPGTYQAVFEYSEEAVGRLALELAESLCRAARDDAPFDLEGALARLRELDEDIRLGPSTGAIVQAALARGIPVRRLAESSLVQFGWGSRQRRIQAAETDRTSAISEAIAQDKELTKKLLEAAGVPVPRGRVVTDAEAGWAAACEIGLPVVVKPRDGNQGKGVTVNILTREHFMAVYGAAAAISEEVLVESFIPGHDHRLLVVGSQLIAAARREPPHVIGDGVHTVRELVDQINSDPRRGEGHATSLTRIRLDDIAIARLAVDRYTPETVPAMGERVILRNNANLSTGGTATDVTDDVHPEVAARAVEAAQMIGLDICGVDVVAMTVHKPLEEQGGGIVEVNAAPGLRMHLAPSYGKGQPVGEAIVSAIFPAGEDGRIPVVAVTGTNGKTTTVRLIAHFLALAGKRVGMTATDGVYVEGRRIDTGDCSGPKSARNVLLHPDVDAAVLETARGGLLREGLAFDRCKVAVVTNIGVGDHLGLNFITTAEDLAVLKQVVVQNVAPDGVAVLNACDQKVVDMAVHCPGTVIFFACEQHQPIIAAQRAQGKRVVYRDGDCIAASWGEAETRLPLAEIPLTGDGLIGFQIENVMAAVAAAWALEIDWDVIRTGLRSFDSDAHTTPGRFNRFAYRGATLIADYGHNPDAIRALVTAVEAMPARRRVVVISGAGDRRDEDIREQTRILGAAFDEAVLYQDQCQRGRAEGEVVALLEEGLRGAARTRAVEKITGEFLAIDTALARLEAGDLCLILVDQVEAALAHIERRIAEA
ncbi:cyanophycin synthetase [Thiobacillus sedimenti]|uniref:Cyanophycin synthetase n=1 Tax=Thiobacillus sedimenti TaxID=3110231 RepID=A0ABZ1CGG3_9PROT|nr:cyanophycin synthetase [Thiobacillus sp. SCUT-2]WRS38462.1 cyanophycin synthetase [Thiobacillus sp. SCUT-2]